MIISYLDQKLQLTEYQIIKSVALSIESKEMKQIVKIIIILLFSMSLNAQNLVEYEFSDSIYEVKNLIKDKFGEQKLNSSESMLELMGRGPFKFGINSLELRRTLFAEDVKISNDTSSMIGMCNCSIDNDSIKITLNRSVFPGTAAEIKISLKDKNTTSELSYFTDDMEIHKLDENSNFKANIDIPLKTIQLSFSNNSDLKHTGSISGRYKSESPIFFERENSNVNKIKYEIIGYFECELVNMDIIMSELEKKK